MLADAAHRRLRRGAAAPLDAAAILWAPALADFAPAAPARCSIPQNVYAPRDGL